MALIGEMRNLTIGGNTYSIPVGEITPATSSALGGIKIGYTTANKNYAVLLDSNSKAYVNVPWTDTTYSSQAAAKNGTAVSLVTTGEKYIWNNMLPLTGGHVSGSATIDDLSAGNLIVTGDATFVQGIPWSTVTGADDLKAIEALTGTTGLLKKTAANTWTLDTTAYTTNTGTVTIVTAGTGLNTSADQADSVTKGSITTTGTLYLTTSGVTAGSYGPSANATPAYGATFNVPYITVDKYGRVTAASTKIVQIPASDNTDTKQNVTLATTSKAYLTGVTTTPTSTVQALVGVADTGVYLTATAGEISAVRHSFNVSGTEKAYMVFNSTTSALDFIFA